MRRGVPYFVFGICRTPPSLWSYTFDIVLNFLAPAKIILYFIIKVKVHSSCEIEDFVETYLCKLCGILQSRVLRVVCPH